MGAGRRWAWFTDEGHEMRFVDLCEHAGIIGRVNKGSEGAPLITLAEHRTYGVALYVLARLKYQLHNVKRFLDPDEGLDVAGLVTAAGPWSSGERALVRLAAHLYSHEDFRFTPYECLDDLDSANFRVALEALKWRHYREGDSD